MKMKENGFDRILPAILIAAAVLTALVVYTGFLPGLRPVLVFAFLLVAPGLAFVRLLPVEDGITRITLTIALSLALDAVVAMILLYAGAWSYRTIFLIITVISLIGAVLQVKRSSLSGPSEENLQ